MSACMSSASSEPGGAGLGTLGLHPEVAKRMTAEAGFGRFELHDFDDPANLLRRGAALRRLPPGWRERPRERY